MVKRAELVTTETATTDTVDMETIGQKFMVPEVVLLFPLSDVEETQLIVLINVACGNVNEKSGYRQKMMHTCVGDIPKSVEAVDDE
jgi:hypothetical protein